jgi:hypothetical protein
MTLIYEGPREVNFRDQKQSGACLGLGEVGNRRDSVMATEVLFRKMENILQLDGDGIRTT